MTLQRLSLDKIESFVLFHFWVCQFISQILFNYLATYIGNKISFHVKYGRPEYTNEALDTSHDSGTWQNRHLYVNVLDTPEWISQWNYTFRATAFSFVPDQWIKTQQRTVSICEFNPADFILVWLYFQYSCMWLYSDNM